MIDVPMPPRRPKPLLNCPHCGANGSACDTLFWLRAQTCCPECNGSHNDQETR